MSWPALALAVYAGALAALALGLPTPTFDWFVYEGGPLETLSLAGWPLAAASVLARTRSGDPRRWAFALLYLVFAAREADLHRAFTADSMLKIDYYRRVAAPMGEKVLAGVVAAAILVLLAYVLVISLRYLFLQGGVQTRSGSWLLAGLLMLVLVKVLDRAPATLAHDYAVILSPLAIRLSTVYEEGLEAILPLLFAFSAWLEGEERHQEGVGRSAEFRRLDETTP